MNEDQRSELVKQFESISKAIGAVRDWTDAVEAKLNALRDIVFADVLEGDVPIVTKYSQRDKRWADNRLGTGSATIGNYGCLITAVASCLTDAGTVMNPAELNVWLNASAGYTNMNHFVFASVDKLNTLKFYNLINCANTPAPVAQLDQFVADGWFVIVKVDFTPATPRPDEHWVRYLGAGQMMDSWYGDIAPIVPRYRGRDTAQAVLSAAIYKRATA